MANVSIIMGVYNCATTLEAAVSSITDQTYSDWELILCDDGSQDDTLCIAKRLAMQHPTQIQVFQNERNMGLNYTLNRCLAAARGKYIARMDGDDLCHPTRLARELAILEQEPEIAIVSCNMEFFDESGVWGKTISTEYPQAMDFLRGTPFCHAPCLVRREAYDMVGGYSEDPRFLRVEDYHLWIKMYAAGYQGKNIQACLYQMRDDRNAYSRRKMKYRFNEAYVRGLAVHQLKLPLWGYLWAVRPILVGLLPKGLYDLLHKWKLRGGQ